MQLHRFIQDVGLRQMPVVFLLFLLGVFVLWMEQRHAAKPPSLGTHSTCRYACALITAAGSVVSQWSCYE